MAAPSSTPRPQSDSARLLRRTWKAMPPEDREAAVRATATSNVGAVQGLRLAILKAMRLRPATVQGWSARQLADASVRVAVGDDLIAELLVAFHLAERVSLLSAFLDAAGVPHTDGVTDEAEVTASLPPETVLAAADHVLQHFSPEHCQVYFATLLALEGGAWEPLRQRLGADLAG